MFGGGPFENVTLRDVVKLSITAFDGSIKGLPIDWGAANKAEEVDSYLGVIMGSFCNTGEIMQIIWSNSLGEKDITPEDASRTSRIIGLHADDLIAFVERLKAADTSKGPIKFCEDLDEFVDGFFAKIAHQKLLRN